MLHLSVWLCERDGRSTHHGGGGKGVDRNEADRERVEERAEEGVHYMNGDETEVAVVDVRRKGVDRVVWPEV